MGDPACWLHQVCERCGQVADTLDADRRCPRCAARVTDPPPSGDGHDTTTEDTRPA